MPDMTITVGVYPGRVFIRRLYYTFVNRLSNFRMLKYVNRFLKINILTIKTLYIGLFRPSVMHTV